MTIRHFPVTHTTSSYEKGRSGSTTVIVADAHRGGKTAILLAPTARRIGVCLSHSAFTPPSRGRHGVFSADTTATATANTTAADAANVTALIRVTHGSIVGSSAAALVVVALAAVVAWNCR